MGQAAVQPGRPDSLVPSAHSAHHFVAGAPLQGAWSVLIWRRHLTEDTARRLRDHGHRRAELKVYENDGAAELETLIE